MFRFISSLGRRVSPWIHSNQAAAAAAAAAANFYKTKTAVPSFNCSSSDGPEDSGG